MEKIINSTICNGIMLMMKDYIVKSTCSAIDEIFRNEYRRKVIGIILAGGGAAVSLTGFTILLIKPQQSA